MTQFDIEVKKLLKELTNKNSPFKSIQNVVPMRFMARDQKRKLIYQLKMAIAKENERNENYESALNYYSDLDLDPDVKRIQKLLRSKD